MHATTIPVARVPRFPALAFALAIGLHPALAAAESAPVQAPPAPDPPAAPEQGVAPSGSPSTVPADESEADSVPTEGEPPAEAGGGTNPPAVPAEGGTSAPKSKPSAIGAASSKSANPATAHGLSGGSGGHLSSSAVTAIDLLELVEIDVSTASKTSESLETAPAIITAVTQDEIRRWGYQSVGEALQHIVGFYLVDDHIVPNAAVRGVTGGLGSESGMIKVMIDGRSVAFRTTSGNWLGMELVPISAIKQIEVIRGPASALYGADAFLGVVNIITIDAVDVRPIDATVSGGVVGNSGLGTFDVTGGAWGESWDVMLTAAGEMTDRAGLEMPAESPAPRIPSYNAGETISQDLSRRSLVFGARGGYSDVDRGHRFSLSAYGSGLRRGGDFAQWAQLSAGVDDQGREVGTVIDLGQARVTGDALVQASKRLALAAQATYFEGGVLPDDRIEVASDLYYVERRMQYRGVDVNLEARYTPSSEFNLIVGTETVFDHEALPAVTRISKDTGERLGDAPAAESVDLINVAAFSSVNYQLVERYLKLTGGIRYDHHSLYAGQLSGRVGATSELGKGLVAKVLYGRAFKAPSPYLLFAVPLLPGDVIGNQNLNPQYIDTVEGQLSYRPTRGLSATAGASYSLIQDKAEFIPQGINQTAENVASQKAITFESRVDARHEDRVGGYASFEWVTSQRDLDEEGYQADLVGSDMVVYPAWTTRVGAFVGVPSPKKAPLELTTEAIIVGPRRAADASILENGGSYTLPTYLSLNAGLRLKEAELIRNQATSIALRVKNLIGVTGPDPGFAAFDYPLAPRTVYLEIQHAY